MHPVVLLTDFSQRDWFVGVMKAVIHRISPQSPIFDLCHEVRRGDIREGAFMLRASVEYFPPGSVFCCVVDPGVGTKRRAIALHVNGRYFCAPDNGLLTHLLAPMAEARSIENPAWHLPEPGHTFQGRDIFAPAAAHLASGRPFAEAGPPAEHCARLDWPAPQWQNRSVLGAVAYIDRFGNLIINIEAEEFARRFPQASDDSLLLRAGSAVIQGCSQTYAARRPGELLFYRGSAGLFEVAVNLGDAAQMLQLRVDDPVELRLPG